MEVLDLHPRHRNRVGAPVPGHRNHILETISHMASVCRKTDSPTARQVDDQDLMTRRMAGCLQEAQGTLAEQIKVAVDLEDVRRSPVIGAVPLLFAMVFILLVRSGPAGQALVTTGPRSGAESRGPFLWQSGLGPKGRRCSALGHASAKSD